MNKKKEKKKKENKGKNWNITDNSVTFECPIKKLVLFKSPKCFLVRMATHIEDAFLHEGIARKSPLGDQLFLNKKESSALIGNDSTSSSKPQSLVE